MNEVDVNLFCEIILTEGVTFIWEDVVEGQRIHYYLSVNKNRRVAICVEDEYITRTTAEEYLWQLGIQDLIERWFNNNE